MSNRTLMEINHDRWTRIEKDPAAFAASILELVRGGSTPKACEALKQYGVNVVMTRHHSDKCSVEYPDHRVKIDL